MSRRHRKIAMIERRWFIRFGEPPTIRTDPDLMLRILEEDERKTPRTGQLGGAEQHPGCHPPAPAGRPGDPTVRVKAAGNLSGAALGPPVRCAAGG